MDEEFPTYTHVIVNSLRRIKFVRDFGQRFQTVD